ncbi:hypothetical protein C2W62_02625 [Candidatus Entotheonella serta]|nr:hypothetical protein C2W62_02625 [Candidatus Entotheonella serta]
MAEGQDTKGTMTRSRFDAAAVPWIKYIVDQSSIWWQGKLARQCTATSLAAIERVPLRIKINVVLEGV